MKNYDSKKNEWNNIQSEEIKDRCKKAKVLIDDGYSVKDIAVIFELSESRIRQYLKSDD